jgi:predicted outer membrane repeat protein
MCQVSRAPVAAIAVAVALMVSATAYAATITVNSLSDADLPHICTLRDAINSANTQTKTNGCPAGTGSDTINFNVTGTIFLASTLPQVTDSVLTINAPAAPGIEISGRGAVQVMTVASGARLDLNGLTIADGAFGIFADNGGGCIRNDGTLTATNTTFSNCASRGYGGAIFNDGTLTVTNSTFSSNRGSPKSGGLGGAIFNSGTLTVTNSTFSSNRAYPFAGAIANEGSMTVTNSTFFGNHAVLGGAILGSVTVTKSTFSGNYASDGGAIAGSATVTNSTFLGNRAYEGGAIYAQSATTVTNSTFSSNSANSGDPGGGGGAIYTESGTTTISNSTFSGNNANSAGGVIYNNSGLTSLKSTILAASSSGGNCAGPINDTGYNISDDTSCGFTKTGSANNGDGVDPMLSPAGLTHNGGPTRTISLLDGSPAIDAIPLADCIDQASPPNPIITDQRGFPRPDASETDCDIGAYEVQDTASTPFRWFSGLLTITSDTGVFDLAGRFKLGAGGTIDPATQPVMFGLGSYAVRLPAGSFVSDGSDYLYHGTINGRFLRMSIEPTDMPGIYALIAGGTVTGTTNPVPVTLTIGNNFGSAQINATIN